MLGRSLVFLVLTCALVRAITVRQADASCTVTGKTVSDGTIFTLDVTGPCIKYECRDGQVFPHEYGCEKDGKCYPEGDNFTQTCIQRQCSPVNGQFSYVSIYEGCQFKGACLEVGQRTLDNCFTYECKKGGTGLFHTYTVQLVASGCQHKSTCLQRDETVVDGCQTLKCTQEVIDEVIYTLVKPISTKCQDANSVCRDPGSFFPYIIGGVTWPNCTCTTLGNNIHYSCN